MFSHDTRSASALTALGASVLTGIRSIPSSTTLKSPAIMSSLGILVPRRLSQNEAFSEASFGRASWPDRVR
ncbi:hypothetical protein VTO73DRAFT_10970 [Trametes versicolor]